MGIIVVLTGSLVSRYDQDKIDIVFWSGFVLLLLVGFALVILVKKITQKTKEIGEL